MARRVGTQAGQVVGGVGALEFDAGPVWSVAASRELGGRIRRLGDAAMWTDRTRRFSDRNCVGWLFSSRHMVQ